MKKDFKGKSKRGGIYQIRNRQNGKIYIGSAKCFQVRASQHISSLRNNKHQNKHLQASWNKHESDNFLFEVLEVVDGDKLQRTTVEKQYLEKYFHEWEKCYNFIKNPVSNEGPWSNSPEETRKKLSLKIKNFYQTEKGKNLRKFKRKTYEEQYGIKKASEIKRKIGEKSANRKKSVEIKNKMSELNKGTNNPLHGKKHSFETRKKMVESHKERLKDPKIRAQISTKLKGRKKSKKTIEKLRKAQTGKRLSIETKEKISLSNKLYWANKRKILNQEEE